ncbi:hypothetical protein ES288_A06G074700v1 [Gossypium darwinii]|uniref:Uncharacterized protein n=2 Tax=Gossypium TaxID=3633 RepID=A0A5D2Q3H0_GOSTO|nr:hypothetical protein ES288_A06G074700v1 [Gossypium darwinii]TYI21950.1 hypothetical protein ES332_A06G073300v1 [Gossypium tomentosum]
MKARWIEDVYYEEWLQAACSWKLKNSNRFIYSYVYLRTNFFLGLMGITTSIEDKYHNVKSIQQFYSYICKFKQTTYSYSWFLYVMSYIFGICSPFVVLSPSNEASFGFFAS